MNIVTSYVTEWTAIDQDSYDGAPDAGRQCVGTGATEREAINDLVEQIEEAAFERGRRGKTELLEALKALDYLYRRVWDRVDGTLVLLPDSIQAFEEASSKAEAAIAKAEVTQPVNG